MSKGATWNIATASLLPGTDNVHSILMAYEWLRKQNLPVPSAIVKEQERRAASGPAKINAAGTKLKSSR